MDLHQMFGITGWIVLEKFVRSGLVYVFLLVVLRLAGKRELAQLNPFDLVVFLTLSNAVQNAIIGDEYSVTGGLVGAAALMLVNHAFVSLRVRLDNSTVEAIVEGTEDILVQDGKVHHDRLRKELMTVEDLEIAARKQGFRTLAEVDFAALEPGGGVCFVARQPTPQEREFKQLHARLDEISAQIKELRDAGK